MSDNLGMEFFGAVMFEEITPEEAKRLKAEQMVKDEKRRVYVAERIQKSEYDDMPIEEKRVVVCGLFKKAMIPYDHAEQRVTEMTEAELNDAIVVLIDFEESMAAQENTEAAPVAKPT